MQDIVTDDDLPKLPPDEPRPRASSKDDDDDIDEQINRMKKTGQFYSTPKVADLFDVTPETIRNWIEKGELKAVKINGYWRISRQEVLRYANERFKPESGE